MTKEEAIYWLDNGWRQSLEGKYREAFDMAISALRSITREQVEKVWRGEWEPGNPICSICGKDKFNGLDADIWADWMPNFCPNCGAPMTDEAAEIIMERLEDIT